MPKRSTTKRKALIKTSKRGRTSLLSASKTKIAIFLTAIVLLVGGWMSLSKIMQPAGVNEVSSGLVAKPIVDSNGCYEQQIQCVKAPCNPIMVCPAGVTPAPTAATTKEGMLCTQEAGSCLNSTGQCVGYTDGCQKAKLCGPTPKMCGVVTKPTIAPTCIPQPSCAPGQACPRLMDTRYCPVKATPTPTPTPTSVPTCTCPAGTFCKLDARCAPPTPTPTAVGMPSCTCPPGAICKLDARCAPTPTPKPSVAATPSSVEGIASFSATGVCGSDSYLNITFSCQRDKKLAVIANNVCSSFYEAMKKAITMCSSSYAVSGTN